MYRKLFLLLALLLTDSYLFAAEIKCPSVSEIRHGHYGSWLPLYISNEEMASAQDTALFAKNLTQFVVARWDKSYLENGHCFYAGNDPIINTIVFAQDAWRPVPNTFWKWVTVNSLAECFSSNVQNCRFKQ